MATAPTDDSGGLITSNTGGRALQVNGEVGFAGGYERGGPSRRLGDENPEVVDGEHLNTLWEILESTYPDGITDDENEIITNTTTKGKEPVRQDRGKGKEIVR